MEKEKILIQTLVSRLSWSKKRKESLMNDLKQFYGLEESDLIPESDFKVLLHENYSTK